MSKQKQVIFIFSLAFFIGIIRSFFINDPEFTLIKKDRVIAEINSYNIPNDISGPMIVNLDFSKYHYDNKTAIFIDSRDQEDYSNGHIKNSINIPYDYYDEYDEIIDALDENFSYIIYCSGGECSLSLDLADYLYNEKLFDKVFIFEGGWPEWRDAGYP